jgi:hypothetical protein
LRIRELAPLAASVSLGYADTIWKTCHPMIEAIGENLRIWAKSFV